MDTIKYRKAEKYVLAEPYTIVTNIVREPILTSPVLSIKYLTLWPDGTLEIEAGYPWDGPSGPTIDTPEFMRGSLVHDALYDLIGKGELDVIWRGEADKELRRLCLEDGMPSDEAYVVYKAVDKFGEKHALSGRERKILEAPRRKGRKEGD